MTIKLWRPKKLIHLTFNINDIQESAADTATLTWQVTNPTGQIMSEHARIVLDSLYIKKTATAGTMYLYSNDVDSALCFDSKNKASSGTVIFTVGSDAATTNFNNYNHEISKNWKLKANFLSSLSYFRLNLDGGTKADIEELYFTVVVLDMELELQQDTGPWSSEQVISGKHVMHPNFLK